ncbi:uncharacterized protein LOC134432703 [Melospiza melodia melodia]|uniref:uncharacterized protein LOC134432703 n=1 Tax=Melospiza melodia melodia TaxID=1914991 RepID=UPI002FD14B5D
MVAASEATRATMVRQRLEAALWLLERLVATCDKATAFPRELQRLLRDIEAAMKGTNWVSPDVPGGLVAKVAEVEWLWEVNARLAKGHLVGAVPDAIKFLFTGCPSNPSACGVAKRCQRATEDIPRLLQPLEFPQSIPEMSPVTMELQEVSPLQLQVMVDVVATLGKVVETMTGPHGATCLYHSQDSLHENMQNFTRRLRKILNQHGVTSHGHPVVPSLGRALATLRATLGATWANVRATAKAWREMVAKLVDSWDQLAREATKLRDDCRKVITARQLMVALIREEVTWEMAPHDAPVAAATNEAMGEAVVATRWEMVATRWGPWAVVALEPLQRLVAACDRVTLFYWNLEWQLRDIEAILKGTNEASPEVPQTKLDEVAESERLWRASTRLAKDHLLGILELIDNILLRPSGGQGVSSGPSSCTVAEQCQKAIKDIPSLLRGQ